MSAKPAASSNLTTLRRRSARAHKLVEPALSPVDAIQAAAGIYSALPTAHLSLAARVHDYEPKQLDNLIDRRQLLRVPAMRGSIYLLPRHLVGAGLALVGAISRPGTLQRAGFDETSYADFRGRVVRLLAGDQLAGRQLHKRLRDGGWRDPKRGAFSLALRRMSAEGIVVRTYPVGSLRSQRFRYALMLDWLGGRKAVIPTAEEALAQLLPIYLRANGPATLDDIAWWAGVSKRLTTRVVETSELQTVEIRGEAGERTQAVATPEVVRGLRSKSADWSPVGLVLLPGWDPWLMAHRDRRRYLPEAWSDRVVDRQGNTTNVVLEDGLVVGVWDHRDGVLAHASFDGKDRDEAVGTAAHAYRNVLRIERVERREPPPALGKRRRNDFTAPLFGPRDKG